MTRADYRSLCVAGPIVQRSMAIEWIGRQRCESLGPAIVQGYLARMRRVGGRRQGTPGKILEFVLMTQLAGAALLFGRRPEAETREGFGNVGFDRRNVLESWIEQVHRAASVAMCNRCLRIDAMSPASHCRFSTGVNFV